MMRIHIHFHRLTNDTGIWLYLQCRCGHRKIRRAPGARGYQPRDDAWLGGTIYTQAPPPTISHTPTTEDPE